MPSTLLPNISPSATLTYLANTSAVIALIPTVSGAAFLLHPQRGAEQMRLPGPTSEKEKGLLQMYACRQCVGGTFLAHSLTCGLNHLLVRFCLEGWVGKVPMLMASVLGLTTLAMWYTGAYRAMALAGLPGLLLAVTDGFVVRKLVDEKEGWKHWGAVPIGLGLSVALLYYTS